jgi:methylisocitrate lyase
MCGHKAMMLSGSELTYSMCGVPDGLMSVDELMWAVTRIAAFSPLPLIIDGDNGGGTPLTVYRLCERLAKAGAMGVTIQDTQDQWFAGCQAGGAALLDARTWATNIKAAAAALQGTDCVLIARTEAAGGGALERLLGSGVLLGLEEAMRRANMGLDAGADMTAIMDINHANNMDEVREISRRVPGWKMFPDITANKDGPDVDLDELAALGYNFVTHHAFMKGATKGMLEYGRKNFENKSVEYSDNDDIGLGNDYMPLDFQEWIDRAADMKAYLEKLK